MEGLKRQREEEARVAGQLFAKKRKKCGSALLRRGWWMGASRDNKTIFRTTLADRSIVSRNALPSSTDFPSAPWKPLFIFLAISSVRLALCLALPLRFWPDLFAYPWLKSPPIRFTSFFIPSSLLPFRSRSR